METRKLVSGRGFYAGAAAALFAGHLPDMALGRRNIRIRPAIPIICCTQLKKKDWNRFAAFRQLRLPGISGENDRALLLERTP